MNESAPANHRFALKPLADRPAVGLGDTDIGGAGHIRR